MKVKYEEKKIEMKTIDALDWGDSFFLAEDIDDDEPVIFMVIEPNYGLERQNGEEYAIDVESGELYRFGPQTEVVEIRSEINVKKP